MNHWSVPILAGGLYYCMICGVVVHEHHKHHDYIPSPEDAIVEIHASTTDGQNDMQMFYQDGLRSVTTTTRTSGTTFMGWL